MASAGYEPLMPGPTPRDAQRVSMILAVLATSAFMTTPSTSPRSRDERAHLPHTTLSVVAQVASLPTLSMPEIKVLGHELFGTGAPTRNRQLLERRLACRLQEDAFRKVDPGLLERNFRRLNALVETGKNTGRDRDYPPVAGTLLTREYRGVVHRVVATADGQ